MMVVRVEPSHPPSSGPPKMLSSSGESDDEVPRTRMESESSYDGLDGMEPLGLDDLRSFQHREM